MDTLLGGLVSIVSVWPVFPQFLLLAGAAVGLLGGVITVARLGVILVRGWPPPGTPDLFADPETSGAAEEK